MYVDVVPCNNTSFVDVSIVFKFSNRCKLILVEGRHTNRVSSKALVYDTQTVCHPMLLGAAS